jgi:hypothetical protein
VIATSPYNTRGSSKDTSNASDSVYKEEVNKGNVLLVPLSGNTAIAGTALSGSRSNARRRWRRTRG